MQTNVLRWADKPTKDFCHLFSRFRSQKLIFSWNKPDSPNCDHEQVWIAIRSLSLESDTTEQFSDFTLSSLVDRYHLFVEIHNRFYLMMEVVRCFETLPAVTRLNCVRFQKTALILVTVARNLTLACIKPIINLSLCPYSSGYCPFSEIHLIKAYMTLLGLVLLLSSGDFLSLYGHAFYCLLFYH